MPVAFDAVGPSAAGAKSVGSVTLSWTHTAGASDVALVVAVALGIGDDTGVSVTAKLDPAGPNTTIPTLGPAIHSGGSTAGFVQLFGLPAVSSGAHTITLTVAGATPTSLNGGSVSYTGADLVTAFGTQQSFTQQGTSTPSITFTGSTAGNMVSAGLAHGQSITSVTAGTSRWISNDNSGSAAGNGAQADIAAGGSVTITWSATNDWCGIAAVEVLAAGGEVAGPLVGSRRRSTPGHRRGPTNPMRNYRRPRATEMPAVGLSAAVDQAVETDTATALVELKLKAVGQITETDTAGAITTRKTRVIGQASELDAAGVISVVAGLIVGQALETDTGTAVGERKLKALAQASETDTATALVERKTLAVGQASETDTATAVGERKTKTVAQAIETDTATAIGERKAKLIAQAVELDTAFEIIRPGQLAKVIETDTAQPITERKTKIIGQAVETDTATALLERKTRTVAQAVEVDTGAALIEAKRKPLIQAVELDTAGVISRLKTFTIGAAAELDTAGIVFSPSLFIPAVSPPASVHRASGRAVLRRPVAATLGPASEGATLSRSSAAVVHESNPSEVALS